MKQLVVLALFSVAFSQDCNLFISCSDCIDNGCFWQPPGAGACFNECMIADLSCYGETPTWSAECPETTFYGYLRETEASFCMDECSQYFIEHESEDGSPLAWISFPDSFDNIDLYVNRYVEVDLGQEISCIECSAFQVESISLSDGCMFPVSCFVDPCEVASECQINTPTECVSNYCGGCFADFYDLGGNLVNCNNPINECENLSGLDFGPCAMVLGIGFVNGECTYISGCGWQIDGVDYSDAFFDSMNECNEQCDNIVSCNEIEVQYNSLHSENYAECEYDIDCIPVWGHCGDGLGNCHYAVNSSYIDEEVNELVDIWIQNQCMQGVCTCLELPYAACYNSICELAYCDEPNPAGCVQTGCPEGYECIDDPDYCASSDCSCTASGHWMCDDDCGGGTCITTHTLGDLNNDSEVNVLDIVLIVSFILITDIPTDAEFSTGDVNSDEMLNVLDVVAIVQIILNLMPEACYLEPDSGSGCEAAIPMYYYNAQSQLCDMFLWGGCDGVVPFQSLEECENTCE